MSNNLHCFPHVLFIHCHFIASHSYQNVLNGRNVKTYYVVLRSKYGTCESSLTKTDETKTTIDEFLVREVCSLMNLLLPQSHHMCHYLVIDRTICV